MGTFESEARGSTICIIILAYMAGVVMGVIAEAVAPLILSTFSLPPDRLFLAGLGTALMLGLGAITTVTLWLLVQYVGKKLAKHY